MSIIQDFKKFAMRGNVIDLATGVIIGAAFGKIVSSLVDNVLVPPIGYALSGINFSELAITLREKTETTPAVVISYGKFLQSSVDFLIVAICVFALIQAIQHLRKREEAVVAAVEPEPTKSEIILREIRDLLKQWKV
ncbi:MAG: large-conductance mechanosensitive channel protein MscL [Oligoflexus sp.]|nr:large-conductance mechanosensitive channel protein MscL [Oligoflexus sp.]